AFVSWFMFFFPGLSRHLYQPAHNIYLLIYSELGIVGIAAFLFFLGLLFWQYRKKGNLKSPAPDALAGAGGLGLAAVLLSFLFIGFFDHFPWTLQQGRLILWGILGAVAGLTKK
ncbi:MAG: hypothetical protein L0312_20670, partial [Acidobacteria bacterium]|nr:hypothetical protein [Acidobacteriota bacterium]